MTKINFLNRAEKFMSECYISELLDNRHKKHLGNLLRGVVKRKIQEKMWRRLKQALLKQTRKWTVWKQSCKKINMLKGKLITWIKCKWKIEKWVFGTLIKSLIF